MKNSKKLVFRDLVKDKNFLTSIIAIIFSFFMFINTKKVSSIYPYIIFSLIIGFGILLFILTIFKRNYSSIEVITWEELLFMAILLINPLFAKIIGFYVSAFIEVFFISVFISKQITKKSIFTIFLFSLFVILFSYIVFTFGLRIRCPKGVLSLF